MIDSTQQQYDWGDGWYPESSLRLESRGSTPHEADDYETLLDVVSAARIAVACVEQDPQE